MRTEREQLPVEVPDRVRPRSEGALSDGRPSTKGRGAHLKVPNVNGANGVVSRSNGAHARATATGDAQRSPAVGALDWNAFLPPRSSSLRWRLGQRMKRALDILLSGVGLVLFAPLFALVAVLIKLGSPGPIFYVCEYVGYRGRRFRGYKFRTMVADAEAQKARLTHLNHMRGPAFKIRDDPRVTRVGRFLRKCSIDELPQLWNVLRGDMSLVGPRPPLPEEWAEYKDWQRGKLSVIPGITCYWQVNGRSEITDFDRWARLDLKYIDEWSLVTDAKILARTIPAVVTGDGAY